MCIGTLATWFITILLVYFFIDLLITNCQVVNIVYDCIYLLSLYLLQFHQLLQSQIPYHTQRQWQLLAGILSLRRRLVKMFLVPRAVFLSINWTLMCHILSVWAHSTWTRLLHHNWHYLLHRSVSGSCREYSHTSAYMVAHGIAVFHSGFKCRGEWSIDWGTGMLL